MSRSSNLDNVAPDDDFLQPPQEPSPKPMPILSSESPIKKKKTHKKVTLSKKQIITSTSELRQKVYQLIGHTKHPFSSFLARPKVFSFTERDDQEEILVVLRQHWFTNVKWILIAIAMGFLPSFFRIFPVFDSLPVSFQAVAALFWYLMTFAYAFEKFLSWYFNVYIITDERIVDIDFHNLLNKRFSEAKISMIQDVTSVTIGLASTMFNYGTVLIQTAAEIPEIQFENVPNPQVVIKILQQMRTEEEQEAIEGRVR